VLPITSLMHRQGVPNPVYGRDLPTVPSTSLDTSFKALCKIRSLSAEESEVDVTFLNPGPCQFSGQTSHRPQILLHERGEFLQLQDEFDECLAVLRQNFGSAAVTLAEDQLRVGVIHLRALIDILKTEMVCAHPGISGLHTE
jgi:hypothetical protein